MRFSKTGRILTATVLSTAVTLFILLIINDLQQASVWQGLADLSQRPWGLTTFTDLGIGLALAALWMCLLEKRALYRLGWILLLLCSGNLATLLFFLCRLPHAQSLQDWLLKPGSTTPAREPETQAVKQTTVPTPRAHP